MKIKTLLEKVDLSQLKCFYADIRFEEVATTTIVYKNKILENFAPGNSVGAFLRVYNNGKWFYKATTDFSNLKLDFDQLIEQSNMFSGRCQDLFANVPIKHDEVMKFTDRDPRNISLKEKRELCESYLNVCSGISEVKEYWLYYKDRIQVRGFKSSRGRSFIYDYADCGLLFWAKFKDGEYLFDDGFRKYAQNFSKLNGLQKEVEEFFKESLRHLKASTVKPGKYPVVMSPNVVGVFTHESFGHKSEADFMLGDENAKKEWQIGTRVGPDHLSIVDYGGDDSTSGYCPFDDEGFPTQKTYLIKDGILQGRLHSLITANALDEIPTGNARAINFEFEPIVRMTNTYVEAGKETREQVFSRVKEGIYVTDYNHGSGLSTFTIAPSRAYWVRNGKIAEPVKVPVISGSVFETLNKISAISSSLEIDSGAFGGCGKDEQAPLRVADGGPVILVDEMQVG